MSEYNLPGYGTVGESILLDAPRDEFESRDLKKTTTNKSTEIGANLAQLAERGFFKITREHAHGNRYQLTDQGIEAQEKLLDMYGLEPIGMVGGVNP